ncbi:MULTISPECIES: ribbon-helix-helix protein, CopG family [unclassified Gilliamella]|uniref:ribbon-helix-helix protein, CopG family n=1 Tax=unclassified Gilliamella TaxID=2685620 RepID=UPI00130C8604|nr:MULTISPECIES: ribbon-helix-helix protein, CopG family [unclassified Gilliamella]MWP49100.1 ribbon-helix-helix protein, CopG family [Gilliamella sp. Lep-s35]MWP69286.1 ribbon-helix-helix protein, CopG family [Gilliamella sp. Lep-s5]MWP76849.1 ribbon-helix-helix protein, CopG family [Gilliamella sp. Lep-s21]
MALSRAEIQKRSDDKRGVKSKSYKLPIETIDTIIALSNGTGKSQSKIIEEAIQLYKDSL